MSILRMNINGKQVELDVAESRYLSEVLREDLRLTGTRIGCNEAECGICTVLVNGTPVNSCIYPAFRAQGASVETDRRSVPGRKTASTPAGLPRTRCSPVWLLHAGADHDLQGAAG